MEAIVKNLQSALAVTDLGGSCQ